MFRECRLIALVLAAMTFATPAAYGTDHWYFSGKGGFVADNGFGVAAAVGRLWTWPSNYAADIRVELEVALRHNETDNASAGYVSSLSEMVNVYYDFHTTTNVIPYIGAGIGVMSDDDGNHSAAAQGIAGLRCRVSRGTSLIGEYRYTDASGLDIGSHHLFAGVAFGF